MRISRINHVLPRGLRRSASEFRAPKAITITQDERDALFERIKVRLNGVDAVQIAVDDEDWEKAAALSQEYSDLFVLFSVDLLSGSPSEGRGLELITPHDVLARAIQVIGREAQADRGIFGDELLATQQAVHRAELLLSTCRRIENAIPQQSGVGREGQ